MAISACRRIRAEPYTSTSTSAFVDAVSHATGTDSFGTYLGHDPRLEQAIDIFTPTDSDPLGEAKCNFAIANLTRLASTTSSTASASITPNQEGLAFDGGACSW